MKVEKLLHYLLKTRVVKSLLDFINRVEGGELQGEGKVKSHRVEKFLQIKAQLPTLVFILSECIEVCIFRQPVSKKKCFNFISFYF